MIHTSMLQQIGKNPLLYLNVNQDISLTLINRIKNGGINTSAYQSNRVRVKVNNSTTTYGHTSLQLIEEVKYVI